MENKKIKITVIGDSTIDNKVWVWPGIYGNALYTFLGVKNEDSKIRIKKSHQSYWKPELSVIEHLTDMLPNHEICDYTNDGFTTHDCLYGARRDKVFGKGTLSMFPHSYFYPLDESKQDLQNSDFVILSVGGNNFREFLMGAPKDAYQQARYIQNNFNAVFEQLKAEYIEIVKRVRAENKNATIILMTQYYPSFKQNNYHLYPFLRNLGQALNIGVNPEDPSDVIHEIMKKTYSEALKELPKDNVIVADITSSLDPFDAKNHTRQIEPSGLGGKKIAQILKYIIEGYAIPGMVYSFGPLFFNKKIDENEDRAPITQVSINDWEPNHPYSFKDLKSEMLLNDLIKARDSFPKTSKLYQACQNVYVDASKVLSEIHLKSNAVELQKTLQLTLNALTHPENKNASYLLHENAKEGKRATTAWRTFLGSLEVLVGTLAFYTGKLTTNAFNVIKSEKLPEPQLGTDLVKSGYLLMFSNPKQILATDVDTLADELEKSNQATNQDQYGLLSFK